MSERAVQRLGAGWRLRAAGLGVGGMAMLALATACSGATTAGSRGETQLLVSAAASLTNAFHEIEAAFEAEHSGVDVVLNLGGSAALREQILEGAPADVYASADLSNMQQIMAAGEAAGETQIFARNLLQIAVPSGNPAGVAGLADFSNERLLIGLCAEGVPCGDLARRALAMAGVAPAVDTNEPNVRALLSKIEAGELDAGITYVTDVASTRGAVHGIELPEPYNLITEYPIAVLAGAPNPRTAQAFVDFVFSAQGQAILAAHGFAPP